MNKTEKIKLIKGLKDGKISAQDLPLHLASMGLTGVYFTMWHEVKPGVFQHNETGRTISTGEPVKSLEPGEQIIRVKQFYEDSAKIPQLASNEKDIDIE